MKEKNNTTNKPVLDIDISLFDCNCMLGKRADRREGEPWSLGQLQEDMKYYRIAEALVSHAISRDYDPMIGNKELISIITELKNLYPVWCVLPPLTCELGSQSTFVDSMLSSGVKVAISYPRFHSYSLAPWSVGKLLSAFNYYRAPLILPFQQFDWDEVYNICHAYPDMPVITTGINYRQLRYLLPLWDSCSNLYVDSSWFSTADLWTFLKHRGHLENLLFGTNYPAYTPSAAVSMITYADVDKEEKQLVAGGTLRALLANVRKS